MAKGTAILRVNNFGILALNETHLVKVLGVCNTANGPTHFSIILSWPLYVSVYVTCPLIFCQIQILKPPVDEKRKFEIQYETYPMVNILSL